MNKTPFNKADMKYTYILTLISLFFWLGSTVVDPILPLYIQDIGASVIELGYIMSFLSLFSIFFRIPIAMFTTKVQMNALIFLSVASRLSALFLYSAPPATVWLYPARALDAISIAVITPTLISEVSRGSSALNVGGMMGIYLSGYGIAALLGPVICGILLNYSSYSQVILIASSFPMIIPLLLVLVRRAYPIEGQTFRRGTQHTNESLITILVRIVKLPNISLLAVAEIVFAIGKGFVLVLFSIYAVNNIGFSPATVAFAFAISGFANLFGRYPSGILCDRVGERKIFIVTFMILAVAFFLLAKIINPLLVMLSMFLMGFVWGMRPVANWTVMAHSVVQEDRKLAHGYLSNLQDLGKAIGSALSGILVSIISISDVFLFTSALMLVFLGIIRFFKNWPHYKNTNRAHVNIIN